MKLRLAGSGWIESLGLRLGLGPAPAALAFHGMASARVVMVGEELGLYARLARSAATTGALAAELGLDPRALDFILASLRALDVVQTRKGAHALTSSARRWLDPESPTFIGDFLRLNLSQWHWWTRLDAVARGDRGFDIHGSDPDHRDWPLYVRAMFQLARLSAPEVVARVPVPKGATRVLDVAGSHGFFAAALCSRHPDLRATVIDLPAAHAACAELSPELVELERVAADVTTADLPGPADVALLFQIICHLEREQTAALFARAHRALNPGGVIAVLDYLSPPVGREDAAAHVALHYHVVSGSPAYGPEQTMELLRAAGFARLTKRRIRRAPGQTLICARR